LILNVPCLKEDYAESTLEQFKSLVLNGSEFLLNREYKAGGVDFVTLYTLDQEDVGKSLIADGYALCEKKRERRLQNLLTEYMKAQETAKQSRYNLWRYGDITEDDAKEFGISKPVK
jgi:staphylococcal nuclease domain-containing protein 1